MFHESFHHMYDESECDVVFEPNLGNLIRAHDAINRGMAKLGPKWLFPTAVNEKPNQLDFKFDDLEDSDEEEALSMDLKKFECHVDENGYVIDKDSESLKTKLTWYNKNLNQRQKMAVVNVLKGRGRPLPYIIFGPPGTGKTYTLVEVIMQIYYSVPGSRLLVTTPSNSSADLLCERLIEMGKFKPGQLVRLLSFHRSMNEKVPLNLVPYSTLGTCFGFPSSDFIIINKLPSFYSGYFFVYVVSLGDDFHGSVNQVPNKGNIRTSSLNELVGRHRITVGTCSCVGALHQMSFPTGHFTHILVDEAGQATEPDLLISAS